MLKLNKLSRKLRSVMMGALVGAMVLGSAQITSAATLSEAKAQKSEAQEKLDEANAQISDIESEQAELQEQIDQLDSELVAILIEIETTENDVKDKRAEIRTANEELVEAEKNEEEHFESMKLRIQYMYENGDTSFLDSLLGGGNFSDVLNKVEEQQDLYDTDRSLLEDYQDAKQDVEDALDKIEKEEDELEELQDALEEQQEVLEDEISQREKEVADFNDKLADAQSLASEYQSTISDLNSLIDSLTAQEAAEAAAAQTTTTTTTTYTTYYTYTTGGVTASSSPSYSSTSISSDESVSSDGQAVIDYASQFVGNPYVWGGESLTNGCDCSGFVKMIYAHFGVSLPHYSGSLRSVGYAVSTSDMQPGDIVCYEGHVGLYAGNGQLLNASNSKPYPAGGIKYSNVYYKPIICVRRIF